MTLQRPPDLVATLRAVHSRLDNVERNNRLSNATLKRMVVKSPSGNTIGFMGSIGPTLSSGLGQGGMLLYREDGSLAFTLYDPFPGVTATQAWQLYDRGGAIVAGEDRVSGFGLARPWVSVPWINVDQATWPTTSSATFVDMMYTLHNKQHPKVEVWIQALAAAATAGEVQIVQGSDVVWGPTAIGTAAFVFLGASFAIDGAFGDITDLHLQVRRTAGAGTMKAMIVGSWGRQS